MDNTTTNLRDNPMPTRRKQRKSQREDTGLNLKQWEVTAKTPGQKSYLKTIHRNEVTFAIGPPGTGKTFIAASEAILGLAKGNYEKIIVTRPLVTIENERTGFLPGTLEKKTMPFLRPIYDEMKNYLTEDDFRRLLNRETIEVCTLGNMRGRTFKNSFIILDEAQNASYGQLKSALTRIGFGSTMVITGDPDQTDLNDGVAGSMLRLAETLQDVRGVGVSHLTKDDIVRSELVQRIVDRIEDLENGVQRICEPSYAHYEEESW